MSPSTHFNKTRNKTKTLAQGKSAITHNEQPHLEIHFGNNDMKPAPSREGGVNVGCWIKRRMIDRKIEIRTSKQYKGFVMHGLPVRPAVEVCRAPITASSLR